LAVNQCRGANTFFQLYEKFGLRWNKGQPDTSLIDKYYLSLDAERMRASTIASANRNQPAVKLAEGRCEH